MNKEQIKNELIERLELERDAFDSNYALELNGFSKGIDKAIELLQSIEKEQSVNNNDLYICGHPYYDIDNCKLNKECNECKYVHISKGETEQESEEKNIMIYGHSGETWCNEQESEEIKIGQGTMETIIINLNVLDESELEDLKEILQEKASYFYDAVSKKAVEDISKYLKQNYELINQNNDR